MGFYNSPRIITDNIEFSVDAANVKSWSGATSFGTNYGFFGGGTTPPAYSTVDRVDYSNDTATAVAKGPLATRQALNAATGNNDFGYFGGGSRTDDPSAWPAPWSYRSSVDRLDYSSDTTTAVAKGPLSQSKGGLAAVSSRDYGLPNPQSIWKDMTGKGHNATVEGATYQGGNNGVWNFDGTNDEITLSATTDIQAQAVDWTWESWFYIDSGASSYDYLFAYGPPHQIAWYGNQLNAWFNDTDSTSSYDVSMASGSNTVPTGQWTHGVISRIGSAWKMYINGVEKASASASFTVANSSTGPRIGSYDGSQYFLDGKIASMRIYKGRGFTASEVLNNFNSNRTRFGV